MPHGRPCHAWSALGAFPVARARATKNEATSKQVRSQMPPVLGSLPMCSKARCDGRRGAKAIGKLRALAASPNGYGAPRANGEKHLRSPGSRAAWNRRSFRTPRGELTAEGNPSGARWAQAATFGFGNPFRDINLRYRPQRSLHTAPRVAPRLQWLRRGHVRALGPWAHSGTAWHSRKLCQACGL